MYTKDTILWPKGKKPDAAFCGEDTRLSVLAAHGTEALLDDEELQSIADFAASLCDTPVASVTVVEQDRQLFLAKTGLEPRETPRSTSFCSHAMLGSEPLVVEDASKDPRFKDFDVVTGTSGLRFYAGFPLISTEGAPLGALCVIDKVARPGGLTDQQRQGMQVLAKAVMRRMSQMRLGQSAVQAVEQREQDLRNMIDSVPGIAWMGDGDGNFTYINARFEEITGVEAPVTTAGWEQVIHADDWPTTLSRFSDAVARGGLFEDEWRLRLADGSYRWVQSRAVPVIEQGKAVNWFGTVIDIDKAHRLSEARNLLASELSHRIKNIFAVVSGLIALRARDKPEVKRFADDLNATIRALGTAHDYVRPGDGRGADRLKGLLQDLLAPYRDGASERIVVTGDEVDIGPRSATPLALIFHELATNSAKYGALSDPDGHVSIEIRDACAGKDDVCVTWRESSPDKMVREAKKGEGFGSRMLRLAVEGQLSGQFERNFTPDGLDIEIVVPSSALVG